MRHSMIVKSIGNKKVIFGGTALFVVLLFASLLIGKYHFILRELLLGNTLQWRIFCTLRLSRTLVGAVGGFALGVAGFVYQTVFRNPLAAPDIIGVSSGASAGAAAGILFLSGSLAVTVSAFGGALISVSLALGLSALDRSGKKNAVVLSGIAVHSLAQTILMCLKLTADPEKELASIEYWMMGSLNGISFYSIGGNLILCGSCLVVLFLLHRQVILLSAQEEEARMLGVPVGKMRLLLLGMATLVVASIISMTGLISFVGLLAPHCARMLTGRNDRETMLLCGITGGCLLMGADILARSVATTELPVSIFTSLIGAPFLIRLLFKGGRQL